MPDSESENILIGGGGNFQDLRAAKKISEQKSRKNTDVNDINLDFPDRGSKMSGLPKSPSNRSGM
jgi:hypothetical protein